MARFSHQARHLVVVPVVLKSVTEIGRLLGDRHTSLVDKEVFGVGIVARCSVRTCRPTFEGIDMFEKNSNSDEFTILCAILNVRIPCKLCIISRCSTSIFVVVILSGKYYILIVVFPCMLIITQLLFQQNALVLLLKAQNITICTFVFVFLAPTCFNPCGSSSGGAMPVPS
jgi:hypothetical protein